MKTYTRDDLCTSGVELRQLAGILFHKEWIAWRMHEMADEVERKRHSTRPITLVALGNGAMPTYNDWLSELPIRSMQCESLTLCAPACRQTTWTDLLHEAERFDQWKRYEGTDFLLIAEVRRTGLSLWKMKQFFTDRFAHTGSEVMTAALLDLPNIVWDAYSMELNHCGFQVVQVDRRRPGCMVGKGLDLLNKFQGEPSIWWTIHERNGKGDGYRQPKQGEMPIRYVGQSGSVPLEEWVTRKKSSLGRASKKR